MTKPQFKKKIIADRTELSSWKLKIKISFNILDNSNFEASILKHCINL